MNFLEALKKGNGTCAEQMVIDVSNVVLAIEDKVSRLELEVTRITKIKSRENKMAVRKAKEALKAAYANTDLMASEPTEYIKTLLDAKDVVKAAENESSLDSQEIDNLKVAISDLEDLKKEFSENEADYEFLNEKDEA